MEITISPKQIVRVNVIIFLALFLLNLGVIVARYWFGIQSQLLDEFHFGREHNLPTYYSSMALLFCGVLLMVVAVDFIKKRQKYASHWLILSGIFVYLSLDEMLTIHEQLVEPIRSLLHTGGILHFAWVIPYGVLLIFFALAYRSFLINLPSRVRIYFVVSGLVYVFGAMGVEMLGAPHFVRYGWDNFIYGIYETLEESLEMIGIIIFSYAIATYIREFVAKVTIKFD